MRARGMALELDDAAATRLKHYIDRLGTHLKDRRKRESFAIYAAGVLGEGERKSVEPIAARACCDPDEPRHMHEKLLHFVGGSRWSDAAVRLDATRIGTRPGRLASALPALSASFDSCP